MDVAEQPTLFELEDHTKCPAWSGKHCWAFGPYERDNHWGDGRCHFCGEVSQHAPRLSDDALAQRTRELAAWAELHKASA